MSLWIADRSAPLYPECVLDLRQDLALKHAANFRQFGGEYHAFLPEKILEPHTAFCLPGI